MRKIILFFVSISFFSCRDFDKEKNVIYLIGDSTMSEKLPEKRPEAGWGEMLNEFLEDGIRIENHAKNGRSSTSFIAEKRWESIVKRLQSFDIVLIQFGHNDTKTDERFSTPEAYGENLLKFVRETRLKNAIPVLLTPVVRRRFDDKGTFYDTHGEYPDMVRKVAQEQNVILIDLHHKSEKLLKEMGEVDSKSLFLCLEKGEHPNYPDGKTDNTHFSLKGAKAIAKLVAEEIKKSDLPLKTY